MTIAGYNCSITAPQKADRVAYMLYPAVMEFSADWLEKMASEHGVAIVVVYIPVDVWNDVLTPWPEAPEAKGFQPFAGNAADFLALLKSEIIPQAEKAIALPSFTGRDLIGVSLSGLFTLWQWMKNDIFDSIACLSGSFWYSGFIDWFKSQPIPAKTGKAFFLLGTAEPKAKIKAYQTVGVNTEAIVDSLQKAGINTTFICVPGNHFADALPRAQKALNALYTKL